MALRSSAEVRTTSSNKDVPNHQLGSLSIGYSESPPRSSTPSDALKMLIPFGKIEAINP